MNRIVLHVDMDSFYAAIEQHRNPSLKGLPVIVGADPKGGTGRGVVSTCSYEARAFGIHSAMPISRAFRLCPGGVFLPVNMHLYQQVSRRIMEILRHYTLQLQQVSVDEAFLDITGRVNSFEEAAELARQIKVQIKDQEGLTCSIGIAPNKSVAKIASDLNKPDGLTVVEPEAVGKFLEPLEVRRLSGIGSKNEETLNRLGITTLGELANYDEDTLIDVFGKWGRKMVDLARGLDDSEVEERSETKSVSKERTFEADIGDPAVLDSHLDTVAGKVHRALVSEGFSYKTVSVKVRLADFTTFTRARSLDNYFQDLETVKRVSKELASEFFNGKKIRLIGIRLSNLSKNRTRQTTLDNFL